MDENFRHRRRSASNSNLHSYRHIHYHKCSVDNDHDNNHQRVLDNIGPFDDYGAIQHIDEDNNNHASSGDCILDVDFHADSHYKGMVVNCFYHDSHYDL